MTPLEVARKALEIAEANPDHVYQQAIGPEGVGACAYVHIDGGVPEPGCLFGRAFFELGVDPDELLPLNLKGIETVLDLCVEGLLSDAQGNQDVGNAWGTYGVVEPLRQFIAENS